MSYVERILQPGGQIRHISSIHWIVCWPGITIALLAAVTYRFGETLPLTRFWLYTAYALALDAVLKHVGDDTRLVACDLSASP